MGNHLPAPPTTPTPQSRRLRNIAELARLAGVSTGTVSRALAGKGLVNRETRARIQALAHEHGFHPNQMASRLRTGHAQAIAVVVPPGANLRERLAEPYTLALLGHLLSAAGDHGYDLTLRGMEPSSAQDSEWLERIADCGMFDGILLIGTDRQQADAVAAVAARYRPLVTWSSANPLTVVPRGVERPCTVGTDGFATGQIALRHLLARGCHRIAFLGDGYDPEIGWRLSGARAALELSGADANLAAYPIAGSLANLASTLDGTAFDGIIAASDLIALAAIRHLRAANRSVPQDTAVIGFGNLPFTAMATPALTTIAEALPEIATAMISSLVRRIGGEDTGCTRIAPTLVIRESA